MSVFAQATLPPKPRTKNSQTIGMLAAAIIALMAVTQLFTFEDFPAVVSALWFPGGEGGAKILVAVLVTIEVLSLPFLLSLEISRLFRVMSMVFGWCVAAAWIGLTVWENLTIGTISNSGIFGATIPLPVGWWGAFFSLALGVLVGWAAWGMWPFAKTKSKK